MAHMTYFTQKVLPSAEFCPVPVLQPPPVLDLYYIRTCLSSNWSPS